MPRPPEGVTHVPSPRQNVDELAEAPLNQWFAGFFVFSPCQNVSKSLNSQGANSDTYQFYQHGKGKEKGAPRNRQPDLMYSKRKHPIIQTVCLRHPIKINP
jgi:hypothetical protein